MLCADDASGMPAAGVKHLTRGAGKALGGTRPGSCTPTLALPRNRACGPASGPAKNRPVAHRPPPCQHHRGGVWKSSTRIAELAKRDAAKALFAAPKRGALQEQMSCLSTTTQGARASEGRQADGAIFRRPRSRPRGRLRGSARVGEHEPRRPAAPRWRRRDAQAPEPRASLPPPYIHPPRKAQLLQGHRSHQHKDHRR